MSDIDEELLADALREEAGRARETTEGWAMVVTEGTNRIRARRRWIGGTATLVAAAAATIAIALFTPGDDRPRVRVDSPPPTTVAPAPAATCSTGGLDPRTRPVFVSEVETDAVTPAELATARAIVTALSRCDYDGLRTLMAENFTYDFGTTRGADPTIARWKDEETRGLRPLAAVANVFTSTEPDYLCGNIEALCIWRDDPSHLVVTISPDGTWSNFDVLSFECPARGDTPTEPVFADGTPDVVKEKARAILAATADCDFKRLEGLMGPEFRHNFDAPDPVRAINLWIVAQHEGGSVLDEIAGRLTEGAPIVQDAGVNATYEWADPADVNPPDDGGCHCGFRLGIAADGSWQYALAGD